MANRWTRKRIIQSILRREAEGLPLHLAEEQGLDPTLYQAARRIFGSWRNAIVAAGITPQRALPAGKWPPGVILNAIRQLARRKKPMTAAQIEKRHGTLMAAARRTYGSWPKAVIAAGVDPTKFRCAVPWSRERIIEGILTRALKNQPLGTRTTQPRSLVDAGKRMFGSWAAAKAAAGLVSSADTGRTAAPAQPAGSPPGADDGLSSRRIHEDSSADLDAPHKLGTAWTPELIRFSILTRLREGKRLNAAAVWKDDNRLYQAGTRRYGNWSEALRAADLNPVEFWRSGMPQRRGVADMRCEEPVSVTRADETDPSSITS